MKYTASLGIVFFCAFANGQDQINLTEEAIPELVKKGNQIVLSQEMKIKAAEANKGFLVRSFSPELNIQVGQESFKYVTNDYDSSPYYKAGIDINLYNGSEDLYQERINNGTIDVAESNKTISLHEQVEEARKTFWNALYLKNLITKLEEGLNWVNSSKAAALKRISSGVATNSDKFEFEIKMVEINQDIERAKLSLQKHHKHLKLLIGVNESNKVILNQPLTHDHSWRSSLQHNENDHNYLFESELFEIKNLRLKSKLEENRWLPKIDAYAFLLQKNRRQDYDRVEASDRQQTVFGLNATWNLTDFIEGNVQKRSLLARAESKNFQLTFKKRKVENEVHFELKELELLDRLVHEAEENIVLSKTFFTMISKEYKRGVKTSGDMLLATEKLMNSHIRKMKMIRDFNISKAHLMRNLKR